MSFGWRASISSQRHAALLVHEVDEPEVAGAEHDDLLVAHVLLRLLLARRRFGARRLARRRCRRPSCSRPRRRPARDLGVDRAADQVVEAVAVALLEGRALRLAVVGEDDDLVRPRRVAAGAVDAAELLVELAQRLERVAALEPGVVRDLVVAREGRVDRGAAPEHVGDHARARSGRGRRRRRRRGGTRTCTPRWPRGRTSRFACRIAAVSSRKTSQKTSTSSARDVEAVGEERAVAGVRLLLGADPAHGQQHVVGVAREQVAAARAAVREQAVAGRVPPLDLGAVVRVRADHQRPGLLLDPAERGDVLVRAEQDARPGSRRSARRGRSPTRSGGACPRRASAPSAARCRRASRAAAPASRARRSRGR